MGWSILNYKTALIIFCKKMHFIFSVFSFSYIFNKFWSKDNRIWCRMSFERTLIVIREIYYHNIKWTIIRNTLSVIAPQVWQIFNPWKVSWSWIAFYWIFLLLHIVWWEMKLEALQRRSICQILLLLQNNNLMV